MSVNKCVMMFNHQSFQRIVDGYMLLEVQHRSGTFHTMSVQHVYFGPIPKNSKQDISRCDYTSLEPFQGIEEGVEAWNESTRVKYNHLDGVRQYVNRYGVLDATISCFTFFFIAVLDIPLGRHDVEYFSDDFSQRLQQLSSPPAAEQTHVVSPVDITTKGHLWTRVSSHELIRHRRT